MINADAEIALDYLLSPEFEMINSAGKPLTGGYIEVYIHGTRNKYYCYEDWNGTLHPFQIPLDSIGSNVILASPENAYDVYVYNKFGSLIMSRYNVHCQGGNGGSSTYVGDKLFYGQYRASNVTTIANLRRNKGNINLTSNGYLKLKNSMSYHITVRGAFQVDDVTNTETTLNYIEYTSVNPIKIDIDETKEGPQYFELSYDIYRLPDDMDYQVAFAQANGMVTELLVEVHSLSNLATSSAGGGQEYEPGWGIDITNNVISVDPSILDDYVTEDELLEIVTGITGLIPEDVATHTEVYEATVTAIEYVTGMIPQSQVQSNWDEADDTQPSYIQNKPDLDIYATHDEVATAVSSIDLSEYATHTEVYDSSVTAVQLATGLIPDTEEVQFEEINLNDYALASAIPDVSDFTTHTEVYESAVTSIQLVTGLIPEDTVTHTEVYEATVTAIEIATAAIPDTEEVQFEEINLSDYALASAIPDVSDFTTHSDVYEAVVTGVQLVTSVIPDPLEAGQYVSIIDNTITVTGLQPEGDYATNADVYDATVTALNIAIAAIPDSEEVQFEEINLADYALASAIPDVSDFTTHDEVHESIVSALEYVTGIIPDAQVQSDWTEDDTEDPAYIKHKPDQIELVAGQNIGIFDDGSTLTIAASGIDLTGYATDAEVSQAIASSITDFVTNSEVSSAIVTAINYVTGIIPDAQVQSNWTEDDTSDPSYIQNKPQEYDIIAGDNIGISVEGNFVTISASGISAEEVIEIVSSVTGLAEYGQFYASSVYGRATMARTKGTIETTQYGDIKLKKGTSYHVTVRGRYNQTTPSNVYGNISYVEYITGGNININVDKSITESQYFEISYDLYKLNSDTDYQVSFTGISNAAVNDLYIEIHALGGIGGNGSVTGATEYDAGWGIQILNNVISVNPSIIPDITPLATKSELQDSIELVTGLIPDVSDLATKAELQSGLELVTGLIPDTSDMATQTWVNNQGFLTSVPDTYATDTEVSEAIASSVTGFVTESQVTALIPDSEEVQFEELDITQFAQASAIPVVTGFATKSELSDVQATIPTVQLNGDDQVTAINNHEIAGTGGTTYTAGEYISIENDEISVTGLEPLPEIIEMDALEIKAGTNIAIVTGVSDITISVTGIEIPDTSDMATKTWVGNQGYLTSIPDTYATDIEVSQAIASSVTGFLTEPEVTALIPESEEVQFEALDITQFAQASAIPDVSSYATHTEVYNAIVTGVQVATGLIPDVSDMATQTWVGNQGYLTEIPNTYATDIEVSQAIASSVTGFLTEPQVTALIPESEDVTFEEINIANYALASAIPDVSNFVTDTEVTTEITEAVSGKQDLLTGITDVQVVTGLPVSPTQDVLYLIVEA